MVNRFKEGKVREVIVCRHVKFGGWPNDNGVEPGRARQPALKQSYRAFVTFGVTAISRSKDECEYE